MTAKDLTAAKALLSNPDITVEDVAKRLKVSPATLYRHLPGGRSAIGEGAGVTGASTTPGDGAAPAA